MKLKPFFLLLFLTLCMLSCKQTLQATAFTVASYNLRYANAGDSARGDGWGQRCPQIAQIIRFHGFDIFGTQEGYNQQLEDLKSLLPGYDYIGVGRDDGKQAGEHSAIFYRVDLFEVVEQGDFWLSQTPDTPSIGWDAVLPRVCSWGHFRYRATGFDFLFFNLHMDHVGKQARVESAYLVQQKMKELGDGLPVLLTGDFNVDQTHSSYNALVSSGVIRDAYEVCDLCYAPNGTFNNFEADNFTESRIDHIFLSPVFHVDKYGVLTDTYRTEEPLSAEAKKRDAPQEITLKHYRARTPSDHFPVMATVRASAGATQAIDSGEPLVYTDYVAIQDNIASPHNYASNRPKEKQRLFRSTAVEKEIVRVQKLLKNRKLSWMFANCFPNTLDTTVHFRIGSDGKPDTFVYTGDIHAMWLRDSGAQVWPYVQLANNDPKLKEMLAGVILRQFKCINIDPYANAYNDGALPDGHWMSDLTDMIPELHERKWEIDSLCYPLRLAYHYWQMTGDASIFDAEWMEAIRNIYTTFREQQRKDGTTPYKFQRKTERALDTLNNDGLGAPVRPVGLIVSSFRPSDDATTFQFLVPSNFFAVTSLRKAAEILETVNKETALAADCRALADEVQTALKRYATYNHPEFGTIYAFEVDGFGNRLLMDDANVPSLLAMPYLGDLDIDDPIYQNTRRFVWSDSNPYFFSGKAGEGIGGPHIGYDMVWPMSIMMKAFTSRDDAEIKQCICMLMNTDAGTGFMHESFHKDDATNFTRPWFAWQNTLFGELILKLVNEGKIDLLNSIE